MSILPSPAMLKNRINLQKTEEHQLENSKNLKNKKAAKRFSV
jgi:hypothetical protein